MKDEYKNLAAKYDKQLKDKSTKQMYEEWKDELLQALKKYNVKCKTLLDLGCGTGITTIPWIKTFDSVIGVEKSRSMLSEARRKTSKATWVNQNIINLKINVKADAVTCHFDVLNHILLKRDLQKTFNNIYDVLSKNGLFIFDMMSPESFEWLRKRKIIAGIKEKAYSKKEVKEMLKKNGFLIIKIRKQKTVEWDKKPRRLIFLVQKR